MPVSRGSTEAIRGRRVSGGRDLAVADVLPRVVSRVTGAGKARPASAVAGFSAEAGGLQGMRKAADSRGCKHVTYNTDYPSKKGHPICQQMWPYYRFKQLAFGERENPIYNGSSTDFWPH